MNILLVEDDTRTASLLRELLQTEDHQVSWVSSGEEAVVRVRADDFDLVLLDVMLPGQDGYSTCAQIREFSSIGILMLSARGAPDDRIDGLRLGADDYLPKPYHAQELLARVEALSRRAGLPTEVRPAGTLHVNGVTLDRGTRSVAVEGCEVELTGAEFDILRALVERAGRTVPRERLMELARGAEFTAFDRAIDVHISNIRKKMNDDPKAPRWIRTVRGVGYQFAANREES